MAKFEKIKDYTIVKDISVKRKSIKVSEILEGFELTKDKSVKLKAYNKKLDIRPAFQREFVYELKDEIKVIKSILVGFPLSLMYWGDNEDGTFEIIDGQQRTLSILRYIKDIFQIEIETKSGKVFRKFSELDQSYKDTILNYQLDIAILKGESENKLSYFKIINTSGKILFEQELLNASYSGKFISGLRKSFSNRDSEFINEKGKSGNWVNYLSPGNLTKEFIERQKLLEKVLKWVAKNEDKTVEQYISERKENSSKDFEEEILKILEWAKKTFVPTEKDFSDAFIGINWAEAYYFNKNLESEKRIENRIPPEEVASMVKEIVDLPAVSNPKGVVMYLVTENDKYLNTRNFSPKDKRAKWLEQGKKCPLCSGKDENKEYSLSDMHGDHKKPWSKGGRTEYSNLQMLCSYHNVVKSDKI